MRRRVWQERKERFGFLIRGALLEELDEAVGVVVGRVETLGVFILIRRSDAESPLARSIAEGRSDLHIDLSVSIRMDRPAANRKSLLNRLPHIVIGAARKHRERLLEAPFPGSLR
jgi:hypothetical protein